MRKLILIYLLFFEIYAEIFENFRCNSHSLLVYLKLSDDSWRETWPLSRFG